jgi:hypothetical protein
MRNGMEFWIDGQLSESSGGLWNCKFTGLTHLLNLARSASVVVPSNWQSFRRVLGSLMSLIQIAGLSSFLMPSQCLATESAQKTAIPVQKEASLDYVLGPDDMITIQVLGAEEFGAKPVGVDTGGYVDLPLSFRVQKPTCVGLGDGWYLRGPSITGSEDPDGSHFNGWRASPRSGASSPNYQAD